MPYSSINDLPEQVNSLPKKAKEIWMKAFNTVEKQYDKEETAIKTAWSAVKNEYKKDADGNWIKKSLGFFEKNEDLRYTLGVVYSPNELDLQDDFADEDTIRKAAWDYLRNIQKGAELGKKALTKLNSIVKAIENEEDARIEISNVEKANLEKSLGIMHSIISNELGDIVESYIAPSNMVINDEEVKKGSWLLGVQWAEPVYKKIKSGELNGYSMGGSGEKMEVTLNAE